MGFIPFVFLILFVLYSKSFAQTADSTPPPDGDIPAQLNVRDDIEKAMWVWNTINIVYDVGSAKNDLFRFCEREHGAYAPTTQQFANRPINRLFFYAQGFLFGGKDEWNALRPFLRESHARGIAVDYLDGEATWLTKDSAEATRVVESLLKFNATGEPDECFDGFQLDVEPYTLPGWGDSTLWNRYVSFLKNIRSLVDKSGLCLDFGCTIPRWYCLTIGSERLKDVYRQIDYAAILDYVNDEPRLINDPAVEIALADTMHVRIYVGVETQNNLLPTLSFFNLGWLPLEHAVATLNEYYAYYKNYSGVAIHHYDSYATLPRSFRSIDGVTQWVEIESLDTAAEYPDNMNLVVVRDPMMRGRLMAGAVRRTQTGGGDLKKRLVLSNVPLIHNVPVYNLYSALDSLHRKIARGEGDFGGIEGIQTNDFSEIFLSVENQGLIQQYAQAGFDGFVVDLRSITPRSNTYEMSFVPNEENTIVELLAQAKALYAQHSPLYNAELVVRVNNSFLQNLDAEHYKEFMSLINGVIVEPGSSAIAQYTRNGVKLLSTDNTVLASQTGVFRSVIAAHIK